MTDLMEQVQYSVDGIILWLSIKKASVTLFLIAL